ncbi:hypothetical protein BOTBODRAFT_37533 [Botryobasidium botryosum FD-172 SS1]|uniref:Uncharacterized protein n=1 Tax=Botryobasidium botryosum (strain FD-172 SS1) TaxID=930990 RepID=A0A067M021_BOTB1|nr:hypothetical protein BOTBODRAFT_37533 [Botryobasidium botryosum FD-172 SS1]
MAQRGKPASNSLFQLDPTVQELLTLDSFESKFNIKDFVGSISEKLIVQSKEDPGPFDPKPFIRTFESAVDELLALRKDLQQKSEVLEQSVKAAEKDYSKKLVDLNAGFETVSKSFSTMESRMSEVGRTAIRIGEQLESAHLSRQRAQAAYDLIDFYNQFSRNETARLDAMRKEGKEGKHDVAVILRRLTTVAKETDVPGAEVTRDNIDKYCEKFEKDMLRLFDRCYRKGDPKMMAHCAQTLLDFNGGASCVQIYVNQHEFFISKRVQEVTEIEGSPLWESLPDPDASPPKTEPGLETLFSNIESTVKQEAMIIQAVFPNPPVVMQVFLQRVFAQSIQSYLELLLQKSSELSSLAFLRILQLSHVQTSKLVENLKTYDQLTSSTSRSDTPLAGSGSLPGAAATGATVALGTMLEGAMEELFVPYTEGARYLERESKSLGELYSLYLYKFTRYHENAQKAKPSKLFDRLTNQLTAAAAAANTAGSTGGSTTTAQAAAAFINMKFSGFKGASGAGASAGAGAEKQADRVAEEVFTEEDGKLRLDVTEKMLKWHAEAVGRTVELSATSDIPKNIFALLRVLAEALGRSYIEVVIDSTLARVDSRDPKLEPDLQALSVIKMVDLSCHLWQQYVSIALLPLASSSVTVRREMVIYNNQTISRIEGSTNQLLQKITDGIVAWLSLQLAKQKRNDFKPKNDDLSFARVNTEPCETCCDLLEKIRDVARENLSGKNLEVFLTEIGVTFHTLLLDHLKKFQVSATGGLMLAKDLKSYQDAIATFGMPALHERFEFIRQLGNVFLVQPDVLKSYMSENYLGRIESQLLRPYLAQRSDWAQFERKFDGEDTSTELEGKGLKERFGVGRLGNMMKELEGLRLGGGGDALTGMSGFSMVPMNFTR